MGAQSSYRFGEYRLDSGDRLLFRGDKLVPLAPKILETLLLLVERRGHVVEKEELVSHVWPDTFVTDDALLRNISVLRKTLGDGEDGSRYIETIPKRGYRFVAPVEVGTDSEAAPAAPRLTPARGSRRSMAVAALALSGVLLVAGYFAWQRWQRGRSGHGRITFAVLPFENLSGDAEKEYFADGLTEEMITQLASLSPGQMAVIARTSSMKYKSARKSVAEVGRELGVDYVLEGSVRYQGGQLRVSAQLIQVKDQMHLWARSYDRDVGAVVSLQDEIARDIADQIQVTLTPTARAAGRRGTANPQAYDAYLRGRFHWNKRTEEGLRKGLEYFQLALEKDPAYAPAHSGIADSYNLLANFGYISPAEAFPRAIAAARKAIELDDSLSEAYASLAFAEFHHEYDWPGAERGFRRALELNPSNSRACLWLAEYLAAMGRHDEAMRVNKRAQELDPLSLHPRINAGRLAIYARQYDRAIEEMRATLELDANQPWAHAYMAMGYAEKGMHREAMSAANQARSITGGRPGVIDAYCLAVAGRTREARAALKYWEERRKETNTDPMFLAGVHAALGEKDHALKLLDQAYAERSVFLPAANVYPWLDSLRSDARFSAFLRRMNLPVAASPKSN